MKDKELKHEEFEKMLNSFVDFAAKDLKIKKTPKIKFKHNEDTSITSSFGGYSPHHRDIVVQTVNRHPMDIFRTVAHELVHHWQNEHGRVEHGSGETGSPIENEANSRAGIIMRKFGKENPEYFGLQPVKEAVFVVGGPCSGKGIVSRLLSEEYDLKEADISTALKNPYSRMIISTPASNFDAIHNANQNLKRLNYETSMIFVSVNDNISKMRNENRENRGQRILAESVRTLKLGQSNDNIRRLKKLFSESFALIENNGGYLEESEIKKTYKKLKDACWNGYTAVGMKMKGGRKVPNCVPDKKLDEKFENFMMKAENRELGTKSLTDNYKKMTPGQSEVNPTIFPDKIPNAGVTLTPLNPLKEKVEHEDGCSCKSCKKRKLTREEEGAQTTNASGAIGLPVADGIGPEFGIARSPSTIGGLTGVSPISQGVWGGSIVESVQKWMNKEETQERFKKRYGPNARKKLLEAGKALSDSFKKMDKNKPKKTLAQLRDSVGGYPSTQPSGDSAGTGMVTGIGSSSAYKDELYEDGDTWHRKEYQNPKGGLTKRGVEKYREEHPGSKLQTAVTEKNPTGKRAARRKSFCARMKGAKGPLRDEHGKPTRKALALRRWNCHE